MKTNYTYNRHSFAITVQPTTEPVTLNELKDFLRIDGLEENGILDSFLKASRKAAENYTGKSFITQTRTLTLDCFPAGEYNPRALAGNDFGYIPDYVGSGNDAIDIPFAPLLGITSIVTYDTANNATTFSSSNYTVDTVGSRVLLNYGSNWPSSLRRKSAIVITYTCGYGNAGAVPDDIRMAIRQHAADMYNCRSLCAMSCECMGLLSRYRNLTEIGLV